MRRYGRSGWFGQSHRHYLAAKGIQTKKYFSDYVRVRRKFATDVYEHPTGRTIEIDNNRMFKKRRKLNFDDYVYDVEQTPQALVPQKIGVVNRHQAASIAVNLSADSEQEMKGDRFDKRNFIKTEIPIQLERMKNTRGFTVKTKPGKIFLIHDNLSGRERDAVKNVLLHEIGHEVAERQFTDEYGHSPFIDAGEKFKLHDRAFENRLYYDEGLNEDWTHLGERGIRPRVESFAERFAAAKTGQRHDVVHHSNWESTGFTRKKNFIKDYDAPREWFEQNIAGWNDMTLRERQEAERSPKAMEAEAKVKYARETGEYLARK